MEKLLVRKCALYLEEPILVASPYTVRSKVLLNDFRTFVSALEGASVPITNDNIGGLTWLSLFRESDELKEDMRQKDMEARKHLLAVEDRMQQRDCEIASLRTELPRHSRMQESVWDAVLGRVAGLEAEVSALRPGNPLPHSTLPAHPSIVPTSPPATLPSGSSPARTSPASAAAPPSGWNSAIVPDFPTLFEDFKKKQFTLLWRGSRDGFGKDDFHSRCDGHPNTLTVILDTDGNIFGGFTPVEWETGEWHSKADPSRKTFLFTLKNPHNTGPQKFGLKIENMNKAICCDCTSGPRFWDIGVDDQCDRNTRSWTGTFGHHYTNDTGLDGETFFTGSRTFTVKEIEVFEMTD
jgi:hypothetical protein